MYELTQLALYKPIFMTELLLAQGVFIFKMPKRKKFVLRLILGYIVCYIIALLFPVAYYNAVYSTFMFFVFFIVTVAVYAFCYKCPFINIIFCAVAGYTVQHIAYEIYAFIAVVAGFSDGSGLGMYDKTPADCYVPFATPQSMLSYLWTYLVVYWSVLMLTRKEFVNGECRLKNPIFFVFIVTLLIVDIVLSSVVTYYEEFDRFYMLICCIFSILSCVLLLLLQFELLVRKKLEEDLYIMDHIRMQQEKQYAISQENINSINIKYHDLKHQILVLGERSYINPEVIAAVESALAEYDTIIKTGNNALDIILTEKNFLCLNEGIRLSCIADGKALSFMNEVDLYSLFGNLLDNALEAVKQLDDDQKEINLSAKTINGFVSVNISNMCRNEIIFEDGLPVSDKKDRHFHGFGLKSVAYICDKYGADLSVKCEDGLFTVRILFTEKDNVVKN